MFWKKLKGLTKFHIFPGDRFVFLLCLPALRQQIVWWCVGGLLHQASRIEGTIRSEKILCKLLSFSDFSTSSTGFPGPMYVDFRNAYIVSPPSSFGSDSLREAVDLTTSFSGNSPLSLPPPKFPKSGAGTSLISSPTDEISQMNASPFRPKYPRNLFMRSCSNGLEARPRIESPFTDEGFPRCRDPFLDEPG